MDSHFAIGRIVVYAGEMAVVAVASAFSTDSLILTGSMKARQMFVSDAVPHEYKMQVATTSAVAASFGFSSSAFFSYLPSSTKSS